MDKRIELLIKYYDNNIVVPVDILLDIADTYKVKNRSQYKIFSLFEEDNITLNEFKNYICELIQISKSSETMLENQYD